MKNEIYREEWNSRWKERRKKKKIINNLGILIFCGYAAKKENHEKRPEGKKYQNSGYEERSSAGKGQLIGGNTTQVNLALPSLRQQTAARIAWEFLFDDCIDVAALVETLDERGFGNGAAAVIVCP